ncbi:hypothetical protein C2W63_02142 [Bacillus velezensis]|nr:hypothetical protein C2W63_02142 [Bacillus velezensis]
MLYPEILNTNSKKTMPLPAKANFPVVPVDKREKWNHRTDYNLLNPWWDKY